MTARDLAGIVFAVAAAGLSALWVVLFLRG